MDTLGISNAHLIGHSRGGYMVTRMALEYPNLAKSIVIIDSATLMENISFYEEVAQRAKSISDPRERTHYSMAQNSYGTDHITDQWISGILDYTSTDKFKEAQAKAQELYPAFLNDLLDKQNQTSDWGSENLSESQLKYAASDVLYLHQIKNKLDQLLERENKEEIAKKCFEFLKARSELDLIGFENLDIFAH